VFAVHSKIISGNDTTGKGFARFKVRPERSGVKSSWFSLFD
jgi:hypothetical protein